MNFEAHRTKDHYVVMAELPGVELSQVELDIRPGLYSLRTTGARAYAGSIVLPLDVLADGVETSLRHGILTSTFVGTGGDT